MKVLFVTSGWRTHFFLVAPLAWACRAAGHDVRVAGPPSGAGTVLEAGLPYVPVGPSIDFAEVRRRTVEDERSGQDDGGAVLAEWQKSTFAPTADVMRLATVWRPDVVVADPMSVGGFVAALRTGVPAVRHLFGVDILGSPGGERLWEILPGFAEHFAEFGVELRGDPAALTLDPCPPSMQRPPLPTRRQIRFVPYNGPGTVPAWLLDPPARPRAVVTWGASSVWAAGERTFLVPQALEALAAEGLDAVVTLGTGQDRFLPGGVPEGTRLLENFPVHLLLPHTELLVHHGGSATILTGALHRVPQLCLPHLPEQVTDSEAYAATGAGRCLPAETATVDTLRAAIRALRTEHAAAAARLQAEMRAQTPLADVVRMLEALAVRNPAPTPAPTPTV
ncbi:nucleotide disphospho-sugar-binding domain-containing protein [Streptomyces griseoluteus]|uniref:nucleotide disphospho-sugar-binding domain-containing protein n=1 Tax=Streptomyces griseoluteus TaxID=29306 RepID=UPI0033C4F05A